jgi:hypothetical protein
MYINYLALLPMFISFSLFGSPEPSWLWCFQKCTNSTLKQTLSAPSAEKWYVSSLSQRLSAHLTNPYQHGGYLFSAPIPNHIRLSLSCLRLSIYLYLCLYIPLPLLFLSLSFYFLLCSSLPISCITHLLDIEGRATEIRCAAPM